MLNGPIESYYQKFTQQNNKLGEILDGSKIINKFQGMSKAGIMQRRVRGNVLLAGDAARTLDPLLGYGMKNAIKSGYAAAETAITYLNKEVNTLSIYEKKIEKTTTQTKKDTNLRKIFNKLNNQDLNTIVKILADLQKDGINLDTLGDKNSVTKLKHVIKNLPLITRIGLKAIIPIIS